MDLQHILTLERTQSHVDCQTKKSALEFVSKMLAGQSTNLDYSDILTKLAERERLGSTGIGHGVAIPHARMGQLEVPIASLIHLAHPIDFGSSDEAPVDIIFAFIVPEGLAEEHLELISTLATLFNEADFRNALRQAEDDITLHKTMVGMSYTKHIA